MVTKRLGLITIVLLAFGPVSEAVNEPEGTFQIGTRYLDDRPFDPDIDVLDIGDSLYLSIYAEEGFFYGSSFGYYWALVCDTSLATITDGEVGPDAPDIIEFYGSAGALAGIPGDGQFGKMWPAPGDFYDTGLYMDNFLYSPQSVGDATVSFWHLTKDPYMFPPYGVVDSIVIQQIPEPTSLLLLGTGLAGLLACNRKKKK